MRWRQDLQVKLRNRYRSLYTADGFRLAREIDLVVAWISSQSALMYSMEEARLAETVPTYDEWISRQTRRGIWEWPTKTEAGRAVFIWDMMRHISESDQDIIRFLSVLSTESKYDAMARDFTEQLVRPLFDYLEEQIGDGSSVLYTLERYVRQIEWFDQKRLYGKFLANTRQGEEVYDSHLREFLFREGFNMPYSQLRSPSGKSDVLSGLESDDPLVCELKVYDGEHRDVAHLASGVTQAQHYASDHGKSVAHLVIINLTARPLQLLSDGPESAKPPYLDLPNARVYIVQVRGLPRESASRQGKTEPLAIQRTRLLGDGAD